MKRILFILRFFNTLPVICVNLLHKSNQRISFTNDKKPGETLIRSLDRWGVSANKYKQFVTASLNVKTISTYYKPQSKVAILVANDQYEYMSKLATPSIDCDSLATHLKTIGFIVIKIKNTISKNLKSILLDIFDLLEENSYCFFFYAGHGCQLCNTKCMLGIDCPTENLQLEQCVTENFVLKGMEKFKPDLCIITMDMCRVYLDRESNPSIYSSIHTVEDYAFHKNVLITYSTQSSQAAYEVLQIECSTSIDNDVTYELKTKDMDRIVPNASQYVNALCTRLGEDLDVSSLFDKVHEDVEQSFKKQRPIKIQCGVEKRSLYDPCTGDTETLLNKLQEATQDYKDNCVVF
ncbi:uncharacterized protein LOC113499154 isoform X2 [Trichoplusia ni]|uniref:Uncharacterized protein LOC113499154 isoform X2 n=1 Tax=Trichoplusia ni TaxID=7111 RepID=A0A7E5W3U2_TRINI|nr:uncharacterized protein LOC113499154 isoform X2 [Trichoplusia ni]